MPRRNSKGQFVKGGRASYRSSYKGPRSIVVRENVSVSVPRRRSSHRHHSGGGGLSLGGMGGSFAPVLAPAVAGYAIATLEGTDFWGQVPSLPLLGKKGTIVVAMQFLGIGKTGLLRDIKYGLALLSGYELKKEGEISGFGGF